MNARESFKNIVTDAKSYRANNFGSSDYVDEETVEQALTELEQIKTRAEEVKNEYPDKAPIQKIINYIINGDSKC